LAKYNPDKLQEKIFMNENGLNQEQITELKTDVPQWQIIERDGIKRLKREFEFEDFAQALAFTNRVGDIAEAENHHPKLVTEWGGVTVSWWSHDAGGLQHNDFVMAAKTDQQYS
jgi:4a-hydroxytetrahydrobiopterin dehydratase